MAQRRSAPPPGKPQHKRARGAREDSRRPAAVAPEAREHTKRKATWPFVLVMLIGWGAIFGAIYWSHFLSQLPDVKNLLAAGPSRDVTILDDHGRRIARRGLTQGAVVRAQ